MGGIRVTGYPFRELSIGIHVALSSKDRRYERNRRKGTLQPEFLLHRFPIKNGCTFMDVMEAQSMKHNALLRRLMKERLFT